MKTPESGKDSNVLRKTPEEIKRGLECYAGKCEGNVCNECQRSVYTLPEIFTNEPAKDALAYIQQLESSLAQVERERDAAAIALRDVCSFCKSKGFPTDCERCLIKDYRPENTKEASRKR